MKRDFAKFREWCEQAGFHTCPPRHRRLRNISLAIFVAACWPTRPLRRLKHPPDVVRKIAARAELLWGELDDTGRAVLIETLEHLADAALDAKAAAKQPGSLIPAGWFKLDWTVEEAAMFCGRTASRRGAHEIPTGPPI